MRYEAIISYEAIICHPPLPDRAGVGSVTSSQVKSGARGKQDKQQITGHCNGISTESQNIDGE